MPGRKNPKPTDNEKEQEYYKFEKRQVGEKIVGEGGEDLDDKGAVGEVREQRREWNRQQTPKKRDDYI